MYDTTFSFFKYYRICYNNCLNCFCRQGAAGVKSQVGDGHTRGSKEVRVVPAPDVNAELARSMQVFKYGLIV